MDEARLEGVCADLLRDNVNTDVIIPSSHIRSVGKHGHSRGLFAHLRYREDGSPNEDFVLNRAPFTEANFLAAGRNFGCGSSREFAVWALKEFGIKAVFAESFGLIFTRNCMENGLYPICLPKADMQRLAAFLRARSGGSRVRLDTEARILSFGEHEARVREEDVVRVKSIKGPDLLVSGGYTEWRRNDLSRRCWLYEGE